MSDESISSQQNDTLQALKRVFTSISLTRGIQGSTRLLSYFLAAATIYVVADGDIAPGGGGHIAPVDPSHGQLDLVAGMEEVEVHGMRDAGGLCLSRAQRTTHLFFLICSDTTRVEDPELVEWVVSTCGATRRPEILYEPSDHRQST